MPATRSQPAADRNLLFGVLALQMDFINRDALIRAMNAWVLDKARPLGDILRDQGQLSPERRHLLAALVEEHLRQHGCDPQRSLAEKMKADFALNPATDDVYEKVMSATDGIGVDVMLEMSGKTDAIRLGFKILRLGGRVSLLGIPSKPVEFNLADDFIFKGAVVQGINGRLMYKTWYQMTALLKAGKLDLGPAITDRMAMADFDKGMERLKTGAASKILLYPNGTERI